jgi:hypothetical protein
LVRRPCMFVEKVCVCVRERVRMSVIDLIIGRATGEGFCEQEKIWVCVLPGESLQHCLQIF